MTSVHNDTIDYFLVLKKRGNHLIEHHHINPHLGQTISIKHTGHIYCIHCANKTKKSFNQGYCYPCFIRLAECDRCIMKPELCHFHLGTCRNDDWALQHCFQPHVVYLSNTSGLKVGITRHPQIPTRWIDQGAIQAIPIATVKNRFLSGLIEMFYKDQYNDKTSWQKMLKGQNEPIDMIEALSEAHRYFHHHFEPSILDKDNCSFTMQDIQLNDTPQETLKTFNFPVIEYPSKIKSLNLDKEPLVKGTLLGIKGQYLILDQGVINLRKFGGYEVDINI